MVRIISGGLNDHRSWVAAVPLLALWRWVNGAGTQTITFTDQGHFADAGA